MRRYVAEIRQPCFVLWDALPVILDAEIVPSALATSRHGDRARFGVDAVFDQLSDCLHGIGLRKRDYGDRVPIITNFESTAGARSAAVAISAARPIIARPGAHHRCMLTLAQASDRVRWPCWLISETALLSNEMKVSPPS